MSDIKLSLYMSLVEMFEHVGWESAAAAEQFSGDQIELGDRFRINKPDDAIRAAEEAIRINPNFSNAEGVLGSILAFVGKPDEATEHLEAAIRLSPRDPGMYRNHIGLAVAEFARGAYENASDWARKVVQARPTYPSSYRILAACCGHTGDLTEARNAIDRLRKYEPNASIEGTRRQMPFKLDADMERYLDGLRKAGLPEE